MKMIRRFRIPAGILLLCAMASGGASAADPGSAHLVWSQADAAGNHDIYYSRYDGGGWGIPHRITDTPEIDTLPAVAAEKDGSVWVVWSALSPGASRLAFSRFQGLAWSKPETIETGLSGNAAPVIFMEEDGRIWVAWSGFDGIDDDIFVVTFANGRWSPPVRIGTDDAFPDILPSFSMDSEKGIQIHWKGFDGERYREYSSRFSGARWEAEIENPWGTQGIPQDAVR